MSKLLEVKNLKVSYHTYAGEVQSVRGVSFDLNQGEAIAIVGESGCGKSVTAKTIMGLIKDPGKIKEGSEILYEGKNILEYSRNEWSDYRGKEAAIIFQDALAALNPTMRVGKQIVENIRQHNREISKEAAFEEAVKMLEMVGIPDARQRAKQYPHEFSGGMRQRAMIAIAFSCQPKLLIADEPTTALDVTIQAQIMDLIKDLQKKLNTSVILITHDLGVVANVAKRIVVMYSGKVVESGAAEEIFYHPKHPYTCALLNAVPRLDLKNKQELASIEGTPPDLLNPPKGCPFSTRCKYCMDICCEELPEYTKFDGEHSAACWLHHPLAADCERPAEMED